MGRLMFQSASFVVVALSLLFMTDMAVATVRTHTFVLQSKNVTRLCGTLNIITVNGQFPGPTLYVNNGDTLIVKVQNKAQYNATIHWHGVRQIRTGWADGPEHITQCPIPPGGSYTYRFTITGQEGTLWWHAHSSWLRATVYGALIIYPKNGATYPFTKPSAETPVLLGEWWNRNPIDLINNATLTGIPPDPSDAFTINGQPGDLYPCSSSDTVHVPVKKGETNLLRVINAALNTYLFLSIANHNLTVVGVDASYTKPYNTDVLMLGPGQTTDVLVTANKEVGKYYIAARAYSDGLGVPFDNTTTTAILEYEGSSSSSSPVMPTLPSYTDVESATRFTTSLRSLNSRDHPSNFPQSVNESLFYTVGLGFLNETIVTASMNNNSFVLPISSSILQAYYFGINGVFTTGFPDNPPVEFDYTGQNISPSLWFPERSTKVKMLRYGTAVQVILQGTNIIAGESHPLHLHGYDFHIVGQGFGNYNAQTDPENFNLVDPLQRNTGIVPVNGWVAIRFVADNPGVWLMHCHLDVHLTWGLGMAFIVENGPDEASTIENPPADLPQC